MRACFLPPAGGEGRPGGRAGGAEGGPCAWASFFEGGPGAASYARCMAESLRLYKAGA